MVLDISKVHIQLRRAAAQKGKEITLPFAAITAWESGLRYVGGYIGASHTRRCRVSPLRPTPVRPTCLQTNARGRCSFVRPALSQRMGSCRRVGLPALSHLSLEKILSGISAEGTSKQLPCPVVPSREQVFISEQLCIQLQNLTPFLHIKLLKNFP